MNFLITSDGLVAMFVFGAAMFAYAFWARSAREKATDRNEGLEVIRIGRD